MITDDFGLDLDVHGSGLINATIRQSGQELRFRVTFISDALIDLADATVAIAGETGQPLKQSFVWANEPDYWRWDLTREDNNHVTVAIAFVTECEKHEDDSGSLQFDNRGTLRFEAHVSTRVLVATVLTALDTVPRTFGAAEFDVDWDPSQIGVPRHFPYVDYVRLREMFLRAGTAQ